VTPSGVRIPHPPQVTDRDVPPRVRLWVSRWSFKPAKRVRVPHARPRPGSSGESASFRGWPSLVRFQPGVRRDRVSEWSGAGLQNQSPRFESGRDLHAVHCADPHRRRAGPSCLSYGRSARFDTGACDQPTCSIDNEPGRRNDPPPRGSQRVVEVGRPCRERGSLGMGPVDRAPNTNAS
jgi:hypothetical protein